MDSPGTREATDGFCKLTNNSASAPGLATDRRPGTQCHSSAPKRSASGASVSHRRKLLQRLRLSEPMQKALEAVEDFSGDSKTLAPLASHG